MNTPITQQQTDACKALFGRGVEDVIQPMYSAAQTFDWLEAVFRVIKDEAEKQNSYRIRTLADMAAYIAGDMSGVTSSEAAAMEKAANIKRAAA